jgi:hypothetical protein
MAELKIRDGDFTAANAASYGAHKQPDGPSLAKGQDPETLERAAAGSEPVPLFSVLEMADFRSQWSKVQTGFVDEPRRTVEDADRLVASVMQRLA